MPVPASEPRSGSCFCEEVTVSCCDMLCLCRLRPQRYVGLAPGMTVAQLSYAAG